MVIFMTKIDYSDWSKEQLIKELEKFKTRKKYGIVWDDEKVPEKVALDCKDKLPVLQEVQAREIETDKNQPTNVLIEGDNYHALAVLNYTHNKAIDIVIIDPPYNTGGNDFKYNDNYVNEEDSYRHSKWLSFMKNRLLLAKNIIRDSGGIFVFIDENEVAQLRLLMDEIFGKENFKNCMIWSYRTGGAPRKTNIFNPKHDYILFYSKSRGLKFNTNLKEKIIYKKDFFGAKKDENGGFYALVNLRDVIEGEIELYKDEKPYKVINTKPVINLSAERVEEFPSQKPIGLIKFILEVMLYKDNMTVCDFFAGTGTTGKAVLTINKETGSHHSFILCTNNENNIAEDVCYPEVKKYILGSKKIDALGGNLKYFRTDFVEAKATDTNKKKLVNKSTEMLCLKEECFGKIEEHDTFRVYTNNKNKFLGIIYDDEGIEPFKKELKKINKKFVVYVFSLDDSAREEEFEDVAELVELRPIPAVILNVYKRIFK